MTFTGWSGSCTDGHQRGPIKFNCPVHVPCVDMHVNDFAVGSSKGKTDQQVCKNAYGSGACLKKGNGGTYTTTKTVDVPSSATKTMDGELTNGLGLIASIVIPTIGSSFFPGVPVLSPLMAESTKRQRLLLLLLMFRIIPK
ncbi:hypothetical protein FOYG_10545 [Fusarium oxysporum NRRL 32931]|uniref:Murein transglycosylase n=1 Tax=Fusarium oxysporum NRRL 32931 TaxID=660029 RepID=W9HYL3_FUSOX|nr:hypothetical protein FOYG_10545 [Fusarium oxysporum NRRL 32931]